MHLEHRLKRLLYGPNLQNMEIHSHHTCHARRVLRRALYLITHRALPVPHRLPARLVIFPFRPVVVCSWHNDRNGPAPNTLHEPGEEDLGEGIDVVKEGECNTCEWLRAPLLGSYLCLGLQDNSLGERGEKCSVDDLVVWRAVRWFDDVNELSGLEVGVIRLKEGLYMNRRKTYDPADLLGIICELPDLGCDLSTPFSPLGFG